jgi:hypothetical protein
VTAVTRRPSAAPPGPPRALRRLFYLGVTLGGGAAVGFFVPRAWLEFGEASGRLVWFSVRSLGFLAYLALTASVAYGLLLPTRLGDSLSHRAVLLTLHRDLANVAFGLVLLHAGLMLIDATMPFPVAAILVPGVATFRPWAIAAGQAGLYLTALILLSMKLRNLMGATARKRFHRVAFIAIAAATYHGLAAGSDSAAPWANGLYLGCGGLVVFLTAYRISAALIERWPGRGQRADRAAAPAARPAVVARDVTPSTAQASPTAADAFLTEHVDAG